MRAPFSLAPASPVRPRPRDKGSRAACLPALGRLRCPLRLTGRAPPRPGRLLPASGGVAPSWWSSTRSVGASPGKRPSRRRVSSPGELRGGFPPPGSAVGGGSGSGSPGLGPRARVSRSPGPGLRVRVPGSGSGSRVHGTHSQDQYESICTNMDTSRQYKSL